MTWRFENSRGNLKVPLESKFFKDLLEYISNGCGSWKIKTKSNRKPITSDDQALEVPLDTELFTLTASQIEDIRIAFSRIDSLETANHGEGDDNEEVDF